ncbi:MAG: MATE family efflux transporter [Acutalibacteraceae bacterium]
MDKKNQKGTAVSSNTVPRENKMGVMPINKLLITMSLPMIISMLVQALYNIVDSIFVAQLDTNGATNALDAVTLAFPMQMLMIAVASGLGVGINSTLSKSLGQKDHTKANKLAVNGLLLISCGYLLFLFIGLFISRLFISSQTADVKTIEYGVSYTTIVCTMSFGLFGQIAFERLLQSTGKTIFSMIMQLTGAVINLALDPILIFGLGGFPALGVAGAAVATVAGQIVAFILGIIFNTCFNKEIHLSFRKFKPNGSLIKEILSTGIPSIIMQAIGSVMTYCMNCILGAFAYGVTVFGIYFKLQSFIFMPIFGFNNGMVPIIAYNYGAEKKERLMKTIKLSIIYAVSMMLIGLAVIQIIPEQLLSMFNSDDNMLAVGVPALRTISLSFTFAGFCIILLSVFQAVGKALYSMVVSICRQLVILVPAAFLLSLSGNVQFVWWAFPIAEVASLTLSIIFLFIVKKHTIDLLPDVPPVIEDKPDLSEI